MDGTEDWIAAIRFISPEKADIGNKTDKMKVIGLINNAIKADPELFEGEGLFGGLKEFLNDFTITVQVCDDTYILNLYPRSGEEYQYKFFIERMPE